MWYQHRSTSRIISALRCQAGVHYKVLFFTYWLSWRLKVDLNQKSCSPSMRLVKAHRGRELSGISAQVLLGQSVTTRELITDKVYDNGKTSLHSHIPTHPTCAQSICWQVGRHLKHYIPPYSFFIARNYRRKPHTVLSLCLSHKRHG